MKRFYNIYRFIVTVICIGSLVWTVKFNLIGTNLTTIKMMVVGWILLSLVNLYMK